MWIKILKNQKNIYILYLFLNNNLLKLEGKIDREKVRTKFIVLKVLPYQMLLKPNLLYKNNTKQKEL